MSRKQNLYLGKAGQFAAMSYCLVRGWNVATPEVDVGDDLIVIEDKKGIFFRIQVKTAKTTERANGYTVQFNIPVKQLVATIDPEIYYFLMVLHNENWSDKIIISRQDLADLYIHQQIGSVSHGNLMLYFIFQKDSKVTCSGIDFSEYNHNLDNFPIILH